MHQIPQKCVLQKKKYYVWSLIFDCLKIVQYQQSNMQKRIKFDQILNEKHKTYSDIWKNLLQSVNQSSPIFNLDCFGVIAYIDRCLYLLIQPEQMNNYVQVQPMINLQQYFIRPDCFRLNFRPLTKVERYVVQYFISYINQAINTNQMVYLLVIDLQKLGKLIVSKNTIEYINGKHHWKYQIKKVIVQLPSLFQSKNQQAIEQQRIARKFSLSVKKYVSLSTKKTSRNENKMKKANSLVKLNTTFNKNLSQEQKNSLNNNRVATQSYEKRAKSKSKTQLQNLRIYKREKLQIKTEMVQDVKTQPSNKNEEKQSRQSSRRLLSRQKSPVSKPRGSINTQTNQKRPKIQLKSDKHKLSLSDKPKLRIPSERRKLQKESSQTQNKTINIMDFVRRSSLMVTQQGPFKDIKKDKINEFLLQITKIYMQSQPQITKNIQQKTKLIAQQAKMISKFPIQQFDHYRLEQFLSRTQEEQRIFDYFYNTIDVWKQKFKHELQSYVVNYNQHLSLIQSIVDKFNKCTQIKRLSHRSCVRIAILLHELYHFIQEMQISLLDSIIKKARKLIFINFNKETSFKEDVMNYVETYQNIYLPLTDYLMLNFEKVLWILPHQASILKNAKNHLHSFIIQFQPLVYENFAKFRTVNCKSILYATYHSEKQGLSLIKKLDNLKYNLENEIQFKSQLILQGVYMKFSTIKDHYMMLLNQKYHEIFAYFLKVYEKSQNQLNNKLKTIIVINVDYLSDYKCREYREEIQEHYKNLLQSLMLLINHFYYLLKESEIYRILNIAYQFKSQIELNLSNFYNKLQQYRNNSNKTIKMLEIQNKKYKEIYQQLTQRLKKILANLVNQRSILQTKNEILKLESDFETYSVNNKKLVQSMKENEMVYWQDDQFFSTNMNLLKLSLQFLQGKNFKVFFNTLIGDLTMNEFYNAFEQYSNFINLLIDTKLQKLFKPTYTLIQNNLILAQIVLYKQYTQFQIQKSKQLGFDIAMQKTSKVFSTIKRYQNLQKKKVQKIVELYRNSRLNEFNLYHDEAYNCIKLQKEKGQLQIQYITNLNEVRQFLVEHGSIKSGILLEKVEELACLHNQVLIFNKMIYQLSQTTLPQKLKESLLQQYNTQYERLIRLNVENASIQKFKNKLFQQKLRYMQIFYHQKVNIFTRYALCSIEQLVAMDEWKSNQGITRNIRCIFQHVDDVTYDEQGNILTYVIAKDTLAFDKPFNIFEKQGEIAKIIYIHTQNFLRNSVSHSQYACIYIKILIWQIYFTQQVELCFMTESSLSKVKDQFLQIIKEIANQIRYDMKLHHKSYEIAQLNFFINHIQKIKNMHSITDFQWISTIRYYQKLKIVKVQQNQRAHDYSFQIKKPLPYDPSFQLQTNISYGFKESYQYYEVSAYILGKPFATFQTLRNYGFQVNYTVFMNIIKKFQYFIRIIVKPQNFKSINYFHKKILQFSLKKIGTQQQQTLSMPIFFQYQSEAALPLCFPQKYRNFSNPQFSFDLNLIILLQLNKYENIIEKSRLNTQILIRVLNVINIKKNLTMKKAVSFIQQLSKFLQQMPQKQEIYKFCYKYFIVNYQVDDNELSLMLKQLTKQTDNDLDAVTKEKIQLITQFMKQDKRYMIMYGPSSQKTYCLRQMKIPLFYQYDESKKQRAYYIEGIQQFLNCKQEVNSNLGIKLIVQDRYIYHIEPSLISDAVLSYSNKLNISNVQTIFKKKIIQLKLQGNYERLWKKLISFYNVFTEIIAETSLINITELILRCFESHIKDFLCQLEPQQREYYKLTINKDTSRTFLVITHEILYYMLSHDERKKFNEKIKLLPFMEEHRSEQLQSLTCKGLNCEKILNIIKKQKVTFKNIGNYTKQFILIKKYMKYQQPIAIYSTSKITLKLLKQQIQNLQFNKINITLHEKYVDILRIQKYKNILYVIHDLHLQDKIKLTFLKARQQLPSRNQSYYLMLTENHEYRKIMKHCVGFKFPDIEIQDIYKYQTKQGIIQQTQTNCRNIWKDNFFANQPTFLMFLINISVKLPSQYYKKYFARQLIYSKFTPKALAIDTIGSNEEYIKKVVDVSSINAYLIDNKGHHQQITETQVHKKIQKIMGNFSFVEKIIVKEYYKQLISYALADKIYIIKEQMPILPFIITNIHQRKSYILKNTEFIPQLIQVIEEIYNKDKQCTLIIQQPLTSSKEWQQFMGYYLKGIDLINLYSQLRQYTELLTNKQEYVYRLDNQAIPLKDKVSEILYSKVKIIVSQTVKSTLALDPQDFYVNNIIYLNCSLTNNHKKSIAESIIKKIMTNETEEVRDIMAKFQPFVLQLIDKQLLFLNRMPLFLNDIIANIKLELEQLIKYKEGMLQKKKLFYNLSLIKEAIDRQFIQTSKNQKLNKMFLNQILQSVNNFEKEPLDFGQTHYQEKLINLRDKFANSQQQKCIWVKEKPQHESICQSIAQIFSNCVRIECDVPILGLTSQQFTYILQNQHISRVLNQVYQNFSVIPQINTFILLRYIRYLLDLTELYKTIDWDQTLIKNEMKLLNYYYLLDICIQLKVKQKVILKQFEDLTHRKRLIDQFTTILISVQHINLEESDIINYHIFNRLKKVIRSYAIQANQYPLMTILKDYEDRFLSISNNFQQYLLRQSQNSFENSNKSMLIQKLKLIVFDPYNKLQQMCHELSIRIIYVNSQDDIEQLYDYKFKMTIFCIKLKTLQCYYRKRKLIDNCIDIITKKHTDLKENKLEKLVISIDQREILAQIKQEFSVLNLGYNFIKFLSQLQKRTLMERCDWKNRKESYIATKKRLNKEIQLIKTLNPQEISLYIIKLQSLINNFQQRYQQISQISSRRVFNPSQTASLYNIFKLIVTLHKKNEFPMNLSLRLLRNINIEELLSKWEATQTSSSKEQQDWFKNMLLKGRSDNIIEEIQECICQSRYIAVIYEQFNKKIIKEIIQIQDTKRYAIRTIIQINDEELKQFANSTSFVLDTSETKQVIIFLVKFHEIGKIQPIINKCSVLWI